MERLRAVEESRRFGARAVPALRPLDWLRLGWRDLMRCPLPGLAHGLAATLFGALLIAWARERFWLLAGAFSGFMLVAPVVATGLYRISRELGRGKRPGLSDALRAWKPTGGHLVIFGLLLALAGTGWVLTSAALITGFTDAPVRNPQEFLLNVVLNERSRLFEIWLGLGAIMAAPVFASSVISIPLLLDRQVGVWTAVFTSWRVVLENPAPMAVWALLILLLTVLGMATALAGLVLVVPWLAHASWHAYRDLVEASAIAERE
ncbi:MAG: DUF2189 domain-containing protein [Rubrivivax sp.]|nr:DUF2189 domain-containing protein [Rubrivivax sp.]